MGRQMNYKQMYEIDQITAMHTSSKKQPKRRTQAFKSNVGSAKIE